MMRHNDWPERLGEYILSVSDKPFEWGTHDCCTFIAAGVEAMTGIDPMPEYRGEYSTRLGAAHALREHGQGTLRATFDAKFETCPPSFARRGDLALYRGAIGIVTGKNAWFVGAEGDRDGLVQIPRKDWESAWHV